ncbi:hypothetical protein AGOR_G00032830 [Albula goreensis]|uniref:SRCR domain-containing protein n=1 Tax=Albula goreensis TaxID=1534307 RepID=A0A8T3DZS4_9TELE|nr:hypothetical protein AGOR_G00032830 [Albula goreensis]
MSPKHDSTLRQCPSRPWGQNDCIGKEVAHIECKVEEDSNIPRSHLSCSSAANQRPCTNHWPLRLRGGEGGCSGRLEVFHNGSWGTVCDNSWDLEDAQVLCRQLGCGPAQKAHGNATFGKGNGTIWLNEVKCRGTELHLWECPHSLKQHSSCQHQKDAGVTCAGYSSGDSTPTTDTPATTTTSTTKPEPRGRTPVTQPPPSLSIPAVAFVVLGALLFLLLVVLGVLVSQNRGLRRALSKGDHAPLHEAVYEEIEYKLAREGTYSAPRWGSVLSEDPPSGYEDVGDSEGHSLSGELGDTAENYDDVISAGQHPGSVEGELLKGDAPQHYDDVITPDQHAENEEREPLKGDAPQHYDDVITEEQSPGDYVTEDTEQNYDDAVTLHWSQAGESVLAPEGPPAPDWMDYDDVGRSLLKEEGHFETIMSEEVSTHKMRQKNKLQGQHSPQSCGFSNILS